MFSTTPKPVRPKREERAFMVILAPSVADRSRRLDRTSPEGTSTDDTHTDNARTGDADTDNARTAWAGRADVVAAAF
ncbi:MAG: hypothetical protein ACTHON_14070 [Humibacter sp.]